MLNYHIINFSESLSSFALLDSKILAPPDDPDDIFGMGDNFKESVFGMITIQKEITFKYNEIIYRRISI